MKNKIKENEELSYETASPIIEDIVTEAYEAILSKTNIEWHPYEASEAVEEHEYKDRDGFMSFIDGGWGARGFSGVNSLLGAGHKISKKVGAELDRLYADAVEEAKEEFDGRDYDELDSEEDQDKFHDIQDSYTDDIEMMMEVGIQFYNPGNSHGSGGDDKYSAHVICGINWDYDYFRSNTNNWDGKTKDVEFSTLEEMKSKLESAMKEVMKFLVAEKKERKPRAKKEKPVMPVEEAYYAFYNKGNKNTVTRVFALEGAFKEATEIPFYKREFAKYKENLKCVALSKEEFLDLREAVKVKDISLTSLLKSRLRENEETVDLYVLTNEFEEEATALAEIKDASKDELNDYLDEDPGNTIEIAKNVPMEVYRLALENAEDEHDVYSKIKPYITDEKYEGGVSLSADEINNAIETETFDFYSWAGSYFINGDHSGLSDEDQKEADEFLEWIGKDGYKSCVDASEESFFGKPDGGGLAGDLLTYTFQKTGSTPDGDGERKPHGEMEESKKRNPKGRLKEGPGGGYTLYARCEVEFDITLDETGVGLEVPTSLDIEGEVEITRNAGHYYTPKFENTINIGRATNIQFDSKEFSKLLQTPEDVENVYFYLGDSDAGLVYNVGSTLKSSVEKSMKGIPCYIHETGHDILVDGTCDLELSDEVLDLDPDMNNDMEESAKGNKFIEFKMRSIDKKDLPAFISELKKKYKEKMGTTSEV